MEKFRSMSVNENRNQTDYYYYYGANNNNYNNKAAAAAAAAVAAATRRTNMDDLRSYSTTTTYATSFSKSSSSTHQEADHYYPKEVIKIKKSKSTKPSGSKSWILNDPELQRKKRVASYKVYTVEGKMKGSLRKSLRWIKDMVWW